MRSSIKSAFCVSIAFSFLLAWGFISPSAWAFPVEFTDDSGKTITIKKPPLRVVSLVPAITEILFAIGAGESVAGITLPSGYPPETNGKTIVGGFFAPSETEIRKCRPDMIFYTGLHKDVINAFKKNGSHLIYLQTDSVRDLYRHINLLGDIFNRKPSAKKITDDIKKELAVIAEKSARIPQSERKRVIRIMGRDRVMTPGDDSFQNEYIRLAGGICPELGKTGNVVPITQKEWMDFNPQVIYGCGGDRTLAKTFFNQPGWKDVEAVKNRNILYFPCDLTCRAATKAGYFVSWLSARIYRETFSQQNQQVLKDDIFRKQNLELNLDYVKKATILHSRISDFVNKTLIIDFKAPLSLVSTLEGPRSGITTAGNHYASPQSWALFHDMDVRQVKSRVCRVIDRPDDKTSLLFTGADMDNLCIAKRQYRDMRVVALATAGVKSNAVRMSKDKGYYYEPGTINVLLLPSMKLSSRAMTRAIISATEAKSAALSDMDVRSSYTPGLHRATGTGTDNILVVEGSGEKIDNAGGHSKMGELIAGAVYDAVTRSIYKQNGIIAGRDVFQRLRERNISIYDLVSSEKVNNRIRLKDLESVLLNPVYAAFIQSSFSISDDYEKGLIMDLSLHKRHCHKLAEDIAGKKIDAMMDFTAIQDKKMPVVIKTALNGLLNGLYHKLK